MTVADDRPTPDPDRARVDRRLTRLGDLLPETTRDESTVGSTDETDSDERLRREVPPHHGD